MNPYQCTSALLGLALLTGFSTPGLAFDVEAFFAKNFIVDGLGTYYNNVTGQKGHPYPSPEGPWDFAGLKQDSGCNMIVMSFRTRRSFEHQAKLLSDGTYLNTRIIRNFSDIVEIRNSGEFGVMMYVQMPYPLNGSSSTVEKFHATGLRVFQLAYGAQHTDQSPDDVLAYGNDQEGGVTPLGEEVISELNRLNMVVDISHCNEESTLDACRLSTSPVVCTHAGARAITNRDRNHTDDALKAIAATGGVIGVTCVGWIIENPETKDRGVPAFCDHVDYIKKLVGVDHVGVSSDSPMHGWDRLSPHRTTPALSEIGRWKNVAEELHQRGYTEAELKKILGLNFVTLFKKVLKP
ncbi:MAG: membrane dipeptidase [Verrucomicrobiales bacterium]|nr:membrane dipeptidase [Verrucomicrobiales bacterium]